MIKFMLGLISGIVVLSIAQEIFDYRTKFLPGWSIFLLGSLIIVILWITIAYAKSKNKNNFETTSQLVQRSMPVTSPPIIIMQRESRPVAAHDPQVKINLSEILTEWEET